MSILIVSNNWNDQVDMFGAVTNHGYFVPRVFFSVFYFFISLIMLNIIISFILELFSTVVPLVRKQFKKISCTQYLMSKNPTKQALIDLTAITFESEINQNLKDNRTSVVSPTNKLFKS